jgi:hypothetical protein
MENKIKETTEKLNNGTITKDEADKILLDLFGVSISKIIYPTDKEVEKILDAWSDRHGECWDYDADRGNAEKVINSYKKLISKKNK